MTQKPNLQASKVKLIKIFMLWLDKIGLGSKGERGSIGQACTVSEQLIYLRTDELVVCKLHIWD